MNNQAQHTPVSGTYTPGPWRHDFDGRCRYIVAVNDGLKAANNSGFTIADLFGPDAEANARLITEAPTLKAENEELKATNAKLLEALEHVLEVIDPYSLSESEYKEARKVIAKATGKVADEARGIN